MKQIEYKGKFKCNKCGFNCGKHWSNKNKCYKRILSFIKNIFKRQKNS